MGTVAWTKVVEPGDPGSPVTVPLSGGAKHTLTLADYTGTEATPTDTPLSKATTWSIVLAPSTADPNRRPRPRP